MISNKDIGLHIKKLREECNETQLELAKALNVKRETVNQWENGTRDLKTAYTIALAEHFHVSCDEILIGVSPQNIDVYFDLGLDDKSISALKEIVKNGGDDLVNELIYFMFSLSENSILNNIVELKEFNKEIIENDTVFRLPQEYMKDENIPLRQSADVTTSELFTCQLVPNYRYRSLLLYDIQTKFMNIVNFLTNNIHAEAIINRDEKHYNSIIKKGDTE